MLEHFFACPYCFSNISMLLDSSISDQEYIEDCEVCCNPIKVSFSVDASTEEVIRFDAVKTEA